MHSLLGRMKIGPKFALALSVIFAGFAVFAVASFMTLEKLRIRGELYNGVIQGKDLIADILPPPNYIIETYLTVLQSLEEEDAAVLKAKEAYISDKLMREYQTRYDVWLKDLPAGEMRDAFITDSFRYAEEFFVVTEREYFPALFAGDRDAARRLLAQKLRPAYEKHRAAVDRVVIMANERNAAYEARADSILSRGRVLLLAAGTVSAFVSLSVFLVVIAGVVKSFRKLSGDLRAISASGDITRRVGVHSRDEVGTIAGDVNGLLTALEAAMRTAVESAGKCQSIAASLSASIEEASASAEQISSIAHGIADNGTLVKDAAAGTQRETESLFAALRIITQKAEEASRTAEAVRGMSVSASEAAHRAEGMLAGISSAAEKSSSAMNELSGKSRDIIRVIEVINTIAEQPNLLSFNASIEAARAGDQGHGFAVVASEVSKLADESGRATRDIERMIGETLKITAAVSRIMTEDLELVQSGAVVIRDALGSLTGISERIGRVSGDLNDIRDQSRNEMRLSDAVAERIESLNRVSDESAGVSNELSLSMQETSETMVFIAQSATELSVVSDELNTAVVSFLGYSHFS